MKVKEFSGNRLGVTNAGEMFGIEFEVENVHIPNTEGTIWSVIEDGSLRNNGFEFVSTPCHYEAAVEGVGKFYEWKNQHNYITNIRTSTHVHYNVLGYETSQLAAALTAYCIMEPLLFRICGEEREENIYCVPWYRAPGEARFVRKIVDENFHHLELACKYSALYLEPVRRFGTVEFRHAPVWDDPSTMVFWLDVIRSLMSAGACYETGEAVIAAYERLGPDLFVQNLLGGPRMMERLREFIDVPIADIIEEHDSVSVAERCVPSLYTYKVTDSWGTSNAIVEGDGCTGYHRVNIQSIPMYDIDPDEYPDDYDEDRDQEENW